ncbi:PH domain-containing protein [Flavobacterium sp. UBA6135]|uniref:PH domain-containing protein n=1 Tax=Flavobacterium sp. UBA6135 TaxID=1946553 RepID=UPI0025C2A6D0|nr:PH domain-containing protein [Flavobacterium sp. UBA6135]
MTTIFKSSIHYLTGILLTVMGAFLILLALFVLFFEDLIVETIIVSSLLLIVGILCFWILLDTKYKIDNTHVYYVSGPIRGKIEIASIRKIEYQKGWYNKSFLKPTLDFNGIYLYYNKFDDICISPQNRVEFVNYLLTINPNIVIIE